MGAGVFDIPNTGLNVATYKGAIDCSASPNYPAANAGEYYRVSVAGKIGGASGAVVQAGDLVVCNTDGTAAGTQAAVGAYWDIIQGNVVAATTAVSGIVELATDAEVFVGTDTERAMTPSNLTAATIVPTHIYYVDSLRAETYTADGSSMRPYKTILAALTAINTDSSVTHAANYELTNYAVIVAPGTYSDNLTINNQKCLRIIAPAGGVFITGTIAVTQTQQTGDYYSRLEFIGADGTRTEKGPALKLAGDITCTRNNDSLTYLTFKGCWITGNQLYETDGTWVVHFNGCRVAGTIDTGTFTDADSAVLIETTGWNEFAGAITDKVSLYTVDNADFYGAINITPIFDCRITNSQFNSTVSIVASKNLDVDSTTLKEIMDRTPTLTGMTVRMLGFETKGADFTGATVDLSTATGHVIDITTDTTALSTFGTVRAGAMFHVRFMSARTLTHNGTSFILPGARDIVTESGDRGCFISLGSGNWYCAFFMKANGRVLGDIIVATDSSTSNIAAAQMRGQTHVVTGAYTLSLPTAAIGYSASFYASTAAQFSIDLQTGTDVIILNGTALTAGNKATSDGTINAECYVECRVAGKYSVFSNCGLFVDGGA